MSENTFVWDDDLVKEFLLKYNSPVTWKQGEDPVIQKIKEFKESKKPKPLFVTEDGVEITDNQIVIYGVCPKGSWEEKWGKAEAMGTLGRNWKLFHDREKRLDFILLNTPLLSALDVISRATQYLPAAYSKEAKWHDTKLSFTRHTLMELAKENLNK